MSEQPSLEIKDAKKLSTVEDFKFEPIKGYPMLQWKGKRPFTSTQFYPAQLKENHGDAVDGWMNRIYWGDNLQVMSHLLKEFRGAVNFIYIDPPFDSKADYKKRISVKGARALGNLAALEEKQYADLWNNDGYLQFMYERLVLLKELLSDTGCILLHCDYHRSHLLRAMLDEVFGQENFRNEIIVKRPITKNLQAQFETISSYSCGHDNLYLYSKSPSRRLKQAYDRYDSENTEGYWHRFWSGEDRPTMRYDILGVSIKEGQWKWAEGRAKKAAANYDEYLRKSAEAELAGKKLELVDYWRDTGEELEFLRKSATGTVENWFPPSDKKLSNTLWLDYKAYENQKDYPTQKHIELLTVILERLTEPGDLVMDTFMGSATTQVAATLLGRKYIGADINLGAIQVATKRLIEAAEQIRQNEAQGQLTPKSAETASKNHYTGFSVYNVNHYEVFRNPAQAKDLLVEALEIQPLPSNALFDGEKDGRMVKIMPINRIATKADINDLLTGFDYKAFQKRRESAPNKPVESLLLVCMGHEPDLAAHLKRECQGFDLDVEVVDILRDKANLEFKRDAQAEIKVEKGILRITAFYPMNLLQKLSLMKENVGDWRELTESVMIDWNYDGAVFEPKLVDVPEKNELVKGEYRVPEGAGTIRVKLTDLLSESLEAEVSRG